MKISVFMPVKKPHLEERVRVYVYRIEIDSFKFSDPIGRHNHQCFAVSIKLKRNLEGLNSVWWSFSSYYCLTKWNC